MSLELKVELAHELPYELEIEVADILFVSLLAQQVQHLWQQIALDKANSFVHGKHLLLEPEDLPSVLVVSEGLFFLLDSLFVLAEEPLCLVMDEVAEDLKAVSLFDRLLLEELRDDGDPRSELLELCVSVCDLELIVLSLHVDVTLPLFIALDLAEQLPPLGHQLIVSILEVLRSLLAFSEHLHLLL